MRKGPESGVGGSLMTQLTYQRMKKISGLRREVNSGRGKNRKSG